MIRRPRSVVTRNCHRAETLRRWFMLASMWICLAGFSASGLAACFPVPSGVVGWWPGEGDVTDIVSTNDGSLQGGATANSIGMVGSAFSFDGTNGYVQIPDSAVFHPSNLTI